MVCVNRNYLFDINKKNPDEKQFVIVIDKTLITDEEHYKLFRNINRYYLSEIEDTLDVLYTNQLMDICFNNKSLENLKFNTVNEMLEDNQNMNNVLIQEYKK